MAEVRQQLIRLAQGKENRQGLTGWEKVNVEKAKVTREEEGKQQQHQNQPGKLKCDSSDSKSGSDLGSEMVTVKEKGKGIKTKKIHKKKQNLKGKGKGEATSGVEEKEEHNPLDKLQCHSSDSSSESGSKSCSDSDSKSGSVSGNKTDLKSSSNATKGKEEKKGTKRVHKKKLNVKDKEKDDDKKKASKEGMDYEGDHNDKFQCHKSDSSSDSESKSGSGSSSNSGSKSGSDSCPKSGSKANSKSISKVGSTAMKEKEKRKGTKKVHLRKLNVKGNAKEDIMLDDNKMSSKGVNYEKVHNDKLQCHTSSSSDSGSKSGSSDSGSKSGSSDSGSKSGSDSDSKSSSKSSSDSGSKSGSDANSKSVAKVRSIEQKEKERRKGTKKAHKKKLNIKGKKKGKITSGKVSVLDVEKHAHKQGFNGEKELNILDKLQCDSSGSSSKSGSKSYSSNSSSKSGSGNTICRSKIDLASYPYDTEGMKGNGDKKKNITKKNEKASIYNMDEEGNKITIVEQETETSTVTTKTIWEYPNEPKLYGLTKKKKSFLKNIKEKFPDHHEKQRKGIPKIVSKEKGMLGKIIM